VRTLVLLGALLALIFGTVAAGVKWSSASWSPKLALDLAGGTQIILTPIVEPGQGKVTDSTINDAISIMRQRVDSTGVSEAQVSSLGGRNIVVELPGDPQEQQATIDLVKRSAQMRFRPVLVEQPVGLPAPAPAPQPTATGTPTAGQPTQGASPTATSTPTAPAPTATTNGRAVPKALATAQAAPKAAATPSPTGSGAATATPSGKAPAPNPTPTNASDLAWITPDVEKAFTELDCSKPENLAGGIQDDTQKPLVTCAQDGSAKYILGPVEVQGHDIKTASAGMVTNQQGYSTGEWAVNLEFDKQGTTAFREVTQRLTGAQPPTDQFAIVLDGLVISAPQSRAVISDGRAQITGNFTQESATALANQLKFGALPISFQVQTEEQISALLGSEQLRNGILAGVIGLLLIVIYSIFQYRALSLLVIGSLAVAGLVTYGLITMMGWYQGYRLSLPGVTGLIISIGVTADSFIVYFERIKDELREGRTLLAAVENGWIRARRTIIIADCINFLAAAILYILAVGGVRGFAFTLGLTTVVDVVMVLMFTHPMMVLLAKVPYFANGGRWSGVSVQSVARRPAAYAGRGRVRTPEERLTRAERAARKKEAAAAEATAGDQDLALVGSGSRVSSSRGASGKSAGTGSGRMTIAERKAQQQRLADEGDAAGEDASGDAAARRDDADQASRED
jgi:preprotein translocase subunit SecD